MAKADSSPSEPTKKSKRPSMKINRTYVGGIAILIVLGGGGYMAYHQYDTVKKENQRVKQENAKLADPQESAKLETQRIKDQVSKLIDVPQGEDPTIASVVDASKLNNQAFFKNAKNGDKVLMYAQAKKAILYRPDTNKIIEVAPINIGNNAQPAAPAGTETPQ